MHQTPPHTKVQTTKTYSDGSKEIVSHSVHKALSSVKQQISQSIATSSASLAADVLKCLPHITQGDTPELTITITRDKQTGEPRRIIKKWTISSEYYGR